MLIVLQLFTPIVLCGPTAQAGEMSTPFQANNSQAATKPPVVLLHGLARSAASMRPMQQALQQAGYPVLNLDYPSTTHPIDMLANEHAQPAIKRFLKNQNYSETTPVSFVTHSMGGIMVRYLERHKLVTIKRVVMLAPPNQGSEIVDHLGSWKLFRWINGPAGQSLSTMPDSMPRRLGPISAPTGIIAGTTSYSPWYSLLFAGPHDGKVSVKSTYLEGMQDHLRLPVSHTFIMRNPAVIKQSLHFLQHERFAR
jgi:pimeloyl-ACP methyl ester carboxylesterase